MKRHCEDVLTTLRKFHKQKMHKIPGTSTQAKTQENLQHFSQFDKPQKVLLF